MNAPITNTAPHLRSRIGQAVRLQQQGRYPEAEQIYREVLAEAPGQPDALHFLGLLAYQTGRAELAQELMSESLALVPDNPNFIFNYARFLTELSRWKEALPLYQRLLELDPRNINAWYGMGQALHATGHLEDAAGCWQRGIGVAPDHVPSWLGLVDALQALNRGAEALSACRQGYAATRRDPQMALRLAEALADHGSTDEALGLLDGLLARDPGSAAGHYQKGVLLTAQGKFPEAQAEFAEALRLKPDFYQALVHATAIRKLPMQDPLVVSLREKVARDTWSIPGQAVNANFALAKIYEDNGDYDQAFKCYLEGNRRYRETIDYSTESQRQYYGSIRGAFDAEFLKRRRGGNPSQVPVFVVGMPRSGTTLVEQILAGHPSVSTGGEMTLLNETLHRTLGERYWTDFADTIATLDAGVFAGVARDYLAVSQALYPTALRIVDKMPSNFMLLGLIHALFPNARIIHCRRDPLDTCLSCFTTLFKNGQLYSYDLRELGEFYRLYESLMERWKSLLPPETLLEVRYENVVVDFEAQARALIAHCGLPWDPMCLEFNVANRVVRTASTFQVRQPLYRSSMQRWRRFAAHLGPLADALGISLEKDLPPG